ncbi:MAG TPA: type II toxin-antitoxin system HicA family toxin [Streptosporangiaceae bacterium]|nr:type II toxin-antitoxin system HicA family toxin [Streptosporangiaceae bacterium]
MRPAKLFARITNGTVTNIAFSDLVILLNSLRFREIGGKGSHRVFARPGVTEFLTLQEECGQAKPYQVRQVATLSRRSNLHLEGEP